MKKKICSILCTFLVLASSACQGELDDNTTSIEQESIENESALDLSDLESNRCVAFPSSSQSEQCDEGLVCLVNTIYDFGTCGEPQVDGSICMLGNQCLSGHCDYVEQSDGRWESICLETELAEEGDRCSSNTGDRALTCDEGLLCEEYSVYDWGTCVVASYAGKGDRCASFNGGTEYTCGEGLECEEYSIYDWGICVSTEYAEEGDRCASNNGDVEYTCEEGLRCEEYSVYDWGTCVID